MIFCKRRLLLFISAFLPLLFLVYSPSNAQYAEIGLGIGGTTYTGDLVRGYDITLNRPVVTAFYRRNVSNPVSFRFGILGGSVIGNDERPIDVFAEQRDYSFNIFVLEGSALLEYNFLNFNDPKAMVKLSPFIYGGIGVFTFFGNDEKKESYSNIQPVVPFGFGLKYRIGPQWILSAEIGARKTFFDYLDNVSLGDPAISKEEQQYFYGNRHDKDWYYFLGFTISYTFYSIPCPFNFN